MGAITASSYIGRNQHEIFAHEINGRIEELKTAIREAQQEGAEPDLDMAEELDALIEFRGRVRIETGMAFDRATIVPEDEFEDFARDWAHGTGEIEFLDRYVAWKQFADDLRDEHYIQLDFGDDVVYVK